MRNLMDAVGPGYAPPVALGAIMVGGTVSRVEVSRHPEFREGDLVLANAGWQDYALSDGSDLLALGDAAAPVAGARRPRHAGLHRVRRPAGHRPAEGR